MKEVEFNEKIEDVLDEQFPKGDKARGRALILHTIAQLEYSNARQKFIEEFEKKFISKHKVKMMNLNGEEYLPIVIKKKEWKEFKEKTK